MIRLYSFIVSIILFTSCLEAELDIKNHLFLEPLPQEAFSPIENISTPEKIKLGKALFYDPILSGNKRISCASCHHPSKGYSDGLDLSIGFDGKGIGELRTGTKFTKRNAPTILNAAFNGIEANAEYSEDLAVMFWDNRMKSLEEQCFGPLLSELEMKGPNYSVTDFLDTLEKRLNSIPEYSYLFFEAFNDSIVSIDNVVKAIAAFERTLITPNSRFDEFVRGNENALNEKEIRGLEGFLEVGCQNCHNGPMFSDYKLHVLGVKENPKLVDPDTGALQYSFRTPTLRNLSFTAPYMHNGVFTSIEQVMDFYEGKESENPHIPTSDIAPEFLDLNMGLLNTSRKDEIIAFLKTLDGSNFDKSVPERVPSGLAVGGE